MIGTSVHQEAYGPENPERVECVRHEGEDCPCCDGSGTRPRKYCAGCGVAAGRPSRGGKALSPERGAGSAEELRGLPLYCGDCNPRFGGAFAGLAMVAGLERMGG